MKAFALTALLTTALLLPISPDALAQGPWHAARRNTYGWQFMTPNERIEHQRLMRSFTSYQECEAYQQERHVEMVERARLAGIVLEQPKQSACEKLRARGRLQ